MLLHRLDSMIKTRRDVEVILAPGALALQSVNLQIDHRKFKLAAQNFFWRDEGPYTGEIAANQLRGLVKYALVGHSERRHVFHEHGREIGRKMQAAVRHGIKPILCVGETATERADGETHEVLHDQLTSGLMNLTAEDMEEVIIAYEPVWAISNGVDFKNHSVATSDDCKDAHASIRRQLAHLFGKKVADATPVLYGGSVNDENAEAYLKTHGVDGLLVGGASLKAEQFAAICDKAYDITKIESKG